VAAAKGKVKKKINDMRSEYEELSTLFVKSGNPSFTFSKYLKKREV